MKTLRVLKKHVINLGILQNPMKIMGVWKNFKILRKPCENHNAFEKKSRWRSISDENFVIAYSFRISSVKFLGFLQNPWRNPSHSTKAVETLSVLKNRLITLGVQNPMGFMKTLQRWILISLGFLFKPFDNPRVFKKILVETWWVLWKPYGFTNIANAKFHENPRDFAKNLSIVFRK